MLKRTRQTSTLLSVACIFLCLFLVGSVVWAQQNNASGELRIATTSEPVNLDPRLGTDSNSQYVQELVYSSLLRIGVNLDPVPDLALSWHNPSPVRYVFELRPGIAFHDGAPLTAGDVKYTFDTLRDPAFGSSLAANYRAIEEINVIDDTTVEFVLSEPFAPFLYYMNPGIVPQHLAENPDHNLQTDPVGSGPFVFSEWRRGERIVLNANIAYFEGPPKLSRIVLVPIPETTVRLIELETGNVDMVVEVPYSDIERLRADPNILFAEGGAAAFSVMAFQNQKEPFSDPRVRRAIAHAVDLAGVVEHVYFGVLPVAYTPVVPSSWAHNPNVTRYEYDPERARELLQEAGVANLSLTLHTWNREEEMQIVTIVQNQLRQVGIEADLSIKEFAAFRDDANAGNFDILVMGFGRQTDPDSHLYTHFHSSQIPPAGVNRWRFVNERVDELLELARTEVDFAYRTLYYGEIQEIIAREVPYITLSYKNIFLAYNARLADVTYPTYLRLFETAKNAYWTQ